MLITKIKKMYKNRAKTLKIESVEFPLVGLQLKRVIASYDTIKQEAQSSLAVG